MIHKSLILSAITLAIVALTLQFGFAQTAEEIQKAQLAEGNYAFICMGGAMVDEGFHEWGGGASIGIQAPLFGSRSLSGRILYKRFDFYPDATMHVTQPSILMDFNLSNKSKIWILLGGEIGEQNAGLDYMTGIGYSHRLFTTGTYPNYGGMDVFGEVIFTDSDELKVNGVVQPVKTYAQLNVGFIFKPIHRED